MSAFSAIADRRSIRKFKPDPIPRETMEKILRAGMLAPSSKNGQPWRFVVVEGGAKRAMLDAISTGLAQLAADPAMAPMEMYARGARHTMAIMEQAPATVFVINPLGTMAEMPHNWSERLYELANVQSVGACIQNMLLTAWELSVGSLWNCDIYFAYEQMAQWLQTGEQIVAAVSFGIPDEAPGPRPRKCLSDSVEWQQ